MITQRPSGLVVCEKPEPPPPPPKLECFTNMLRCRDVGHVLKSLPARAKFVSLVKTELENHEDDNVFTQPHNLALTYLCDKRLEFEEYT